MPFFDVSVAQTLCDHLSDEVQAVVPALPDGKLEPLCAFYRSDVASIAEACLRLEKRAIRALLDRLRTVYVSFEPSRSFLNVNTPEDYAKILK